MDSYTATGLYSLKLKCSEFSEAISLSTKFFKQSQGRSGDSCQFRNLFIIGLQHNSILYRRVISLRASPLSGSSCLDLHCLQPVERARRTKRQKRRAEPSKTPRSSSKKARTKLLVARHCLARARSAALALWARFNFARRRN